MPKVLEEKDWDILLKRVKNWKCTPFLGSEVCSEMISISVIFQVANEWAKKYDYPIEESYDLAQMAQFVAVVEDLMTPKEEVCKQIKELPQVTKTHFVTQTYFETPDEIHGVLANISPSVYVTTNYNDFMSRIFRGIESTMGGFQ